MPSILKKKAMSTRRYLAYVLPAIFLLIMGAQAGAAPLRPEPGSLDHANPELIERLRADPYVFFRFVNRSWGARVCDIFRGNLGATPIVRLHGDAHLEQFALTKDAWGLDDFDDSARGPAAIDIIRFLGSVDLLTRQRSWTKARDPLFDRFFAGYKQGFAEPDRLPLEPDIVHRLRSQAPVTRAAFLEWAETKMEPLGDYVMKALVPGMDAFADILLRQRPDLPPEYFRIVRAGWFKTGVGSALTPKILIRVQGRSDDPADDELLEVKKLGDLQGLRCLQMPTLQPTLRVVDGSKQIGRLKYSILAAAPESLIPEVEAQGQHLRDWWIRNLDPSYRELRLEDMRSIADLAGIAYDAGAQLGAGHHNIQVAPQGSPTRKQALGAIVKLEKQYRREATILIDDLLGGWRELRAD